MYKSFICILGDNIEKIGDYAFYKCNNLKELELPNSIKEVGIRCFTETEWLENMHADLNGLKCHKNILLKSIDSKEDIIISSDINVIAGNAFEDSKKIKSIILPEGLKNIEAYTFSNCVNLEYIVIPKTIEYIGAGAFSNCKSLSEISIPKSITHIYACTFENCESLEDIELPKALEYIGEDAFKGCILLKNIIIPKEGERNI